MNSNPFTLIFGVEPQSYIPRNEEYLRIISDFECTRPTSSGYVITGVRGCGKTVLLTSIQNHFSEERDWFVLRLNPDLDFFSSAISQLGEYIHLKELINEINISIAGFGGRVSTRSLSDYETLLRKMLNDVKKQNKKVLIAIDEASNTKNLKSFAHSYQAFIGEGLPVFLLMTALPENFNSLSNSKNATFLRRLPRINLGKLSNYLIEQKYKEIFDISDENAVKLTNFVMGYPYAFQLLGSLLWDENKKVIDEEITAKLDVLLYDGAYKAIWTHTSPKEKEVLLAMAHSHDMTVKDIRGRLNLENNQFSPYRESLRESGLINTDSFGIISFSLPRFREFILKTEQFESIT